MTHPSAERRRGTVRSFDERRGIGEIEAEDRETFPFHCTAIANGTRRITPGAPVEFDIVAGLSGRWEAAAIEVRSG